MKKLPTTNIKRSEKYNIDIQRNGGEVVIGTITPYQYYYWKNKESMLRDYVMGSNKETYEEEYKVPKQAKMLNWFEMDNVTHLYGAFIETDNYLHIKKINKFGVSTKYNHSTYNLKNIEKLGIRSLDGEEINWTSPKLENEFYFFGFTFNKGIWKTDRALEIKDILDLKKLNIHYKRIEGISICYAISYGDGKPLDLQDDSSGRSYGCSVHAGLQNNLTMKKKQKQNIIQAEIEARKKGW